MVGGVCWGPLTLGAMHADAMDEGQVHVGYLAHEAGCLVEGLWGQARSGGRTHLAIPLPSGCAHLPGRCHGGWSLAPSAPLAAPAHGPCLLWGSRHHLPCLPQVLCHSYPFSRRFLSSQLCAVQTEEMSEVSAAIQIQAVVCDLRHQDRTNGPGQMVGRPAVLMASGEVTVTSGN